MTQCHFCLCFYFVTHGYFCLCSSCLEIATIFYIVILHKLSDSKTNVIGELLGSGPLMGPIFIDEPPVRVDLSNNTGAILTCTATSALGPVKTWWSSGDAPGNSITPILDIAGLRYVRPNGQLVFAPFALNQFRQDVHSTVSAFCHAHFFRLLF